MAFLHSRATAASVNSIDEGWWANIITRIPPEFRAIDPTSEEDDLKRKALLAKKAHVDRLEREIRVGYEHTLKKALSTPTPSCAH